MAGAGTRFANAGYQKPKPFIDVNGKPMIVRVLENLAHPSARYILVARKEHMDAEAVLVEEIERNFNAVFIPVDKLTEGAACTVLYACKFINNEHPLLIANSDQIIDVRIDDFIYDCQHRNLDGSIITFIDTKCNPKWSFAKLNERLLVTEVQEKKAISDFATVGIYLYQKGNYFVNAAVEMFIERDRVNNEYYTCPTYNYAIKAGKKIGIYNIATEHMHGIGTPEDLNSYLLALGCGIPPNR